MDSDPASLDNLRDIVQPSAVSWWPLAPGWWFVIVVVAIAAAVVAFRSWQAWHANAYRRAALHELNTATSVAEIAELLKRTALCAYPRGQVASLSGSAWSRWLGQTCGTTVPAEVSEALTLGVFANANGGITAELTAFAANWIQRHQRPSADHPGSMETASIHGARPS
jgi:phosphatidylglycerophosphate synthase